MDSKRARRRRGTAALVGAVLAGTAAAQTPVVPVPAPNVRHTPFVSAADEFAQATPERVLVDLHHVHRLHMALAEVGMERGSSRTVRSYAQRLYRDHRLLDRRVRSTAEDLQIPLVEQLPPEQQGQLEDLTAQLGRLSGPDFDRMFLDVMMRQHDRAIDGMTRSLLRVRVYPVERLLARITPIVRQHFELGRAIGDELA